jgi:malate dehydrogenase (oxaloacetate-decarboxylating)
MLHAMASVSAQYSIVLRVEIDDQPGMLGLVATAIGEAGGSIGSVDLVAIEGGHTLRDITIETTGEGNAAAIGEAVDEVAGGKLVEITDRTFQMHIGGKIEQRNKLPVRNRDDLSMAYTPGVARVCTAIARDRDRGAAEASGSEIGYSPGETEEFKAVRP